MVQGKNKAHISFRFFLYFLTNNINDIFINLESRHFLKCPNNIDRTKCDRAINLRPNLKVVLFSFHRYNRTYETLFCKELNAFFRKQQKRT